MAYKNKIHSTFKSDNGLTIFYRHRKADPERARLVIAHGLGEHSGRYSHVIDRMVDKGISVWTPDHQGFGKSEGKRGHILRFDQYLYDLKKMIEIAKDTLPQGMKCFLLGHSMGGLMVLFFAEKFSGMIDGVVASSPGLRPAIKVPVIKGAMGKIMSSIWPGLTFDNELDSTNLTHDMDVVHAYDNDPLVHRRVSARWFTQYLSAMEETIQSAVKINVPVLMQVAGDDRIVDARASRLFFESLTANDKTLFFYDGLYHEIYNEITDHRQQVLNDLENWMDDHI